MSSPSGSSPGASPDLAPQDVVLRFLESVASSSEARFYLELFRARPRAEFAAIAIDANVMTDATDAVTLDLRFLASLDLFPVVVLGLFQPAEAAAHARRLHRRLLASGVHSTTLLAGDEGLAEGIRAAVEDDIVPIVMFPPAEGATPPARFEELGRLLQALATRKLIFLHRPGGLRMSGERVPIVNLSEDVPRLLASKSLSRKETLILEQSRRLAHDLAAQRLVVAITSPLNLLRELFTVKGAGTLLRRGAVVERHAGWNGVDRARVGELLASSFGRPVSEAFLQRDVARLYLESDYRGVAILIDAPVGAYLTKFAVSQEAQGEGIARELWDALTADNPVLFWRARSNNPIVEWYSKLCDGLLRAGEWHVFWKGVPPERIAEAVAWALGQPVDIPHEPGRPSSHGA